MKIRKRRKKSFIGSAQGSILQNFALSCFLIFIAKLDRLLHTEKKSFIVKLPSLAEKNGKILR